MFNPPPADLASRDPLIYVPPVTTIWYRGHLLSKHPIFFGKGIANRWDAPGANTTAVQIRHGTALVTLKTKR